MKLKFLTFLCFLVFALLETRAQGILTFTKDAHDFGRVTEGKMASHEFEFTNTGNAPVVISNVTASCGCTTPFWTREPVLPGKKGKIAASYNSSGRPGSFNKSVTVSSNASIASIMLTIKGTVDPKPSATPEELAQSSVFQLQATGHNFGKLEKGQAATKNLVFTNAGKSTLNIKNVSSSCGCVTFKTSKPAIKAGEKATLELRYSPRSLNQQNEIVTIFTNDLRNPTQTVVLQANVVESLTQQSILREQKTAVPFQ